MLHEDELPLDETVSPSPGFVVTRRSFLTTASLAVAAAPTSAAARLRPRSMSRDPWTVEEFVAEVVPVAKALVADATVVGQDRYLHTLAAHAVRLGEVPFPENANEIKLGHWIGNNFVGDPFVVLHWKLAPGAVIRPHPHIYGNVVTIGVVGQTRVRNYEIVGKSDYDTKGPFRVQLTVDQVLGPGDVNLVNLERNYIHGFQAGSEEARGLDITTRVKPKSPTPVLKIAETAVDPAWGIFEANWE